MIQADDLIDIFDAPPKGKLPELARLRSKAGWTQAQMAVALNIDLKYYVNIEFEKVKNEKLTAKIKTILNSGVKFSPYFLLPTPDFKPMQNYAFTSIRGSRSGRAAHFKFFKAAKGANGITHYLFRNKGGSLESFSTTQLMDYKTQEVF